MKKLLFLIIVWTAAPAFAQTPSATPASKLTWDQVGSALEVASIYRYDVSIDGGPAVQLANVICTGTASPFACSATFPAATPGTTHTLTGTATDASVSPPLTSPASAPFTFRFVIAPAAPRNYGVAPEAGR